MGDASSALQEGKAKIREEVGGKEEEEVFELVVFQSYFDQHFLFSHFTLSAKTSLSLGATYFIKPQPSCSPGLHIFLKLPGQKPSLCPLTAGSPWLLAANQILSAGSCEGTPTARPPQGTGVRPKDSSPPDGWDTGDAIHVPPSSRLEIFHGTQQWQQQGFGDQLPVPLPKCFTSACTGGRILTTSCH